LFYSTERKYLKEFSERGIQYTNQCPFEGIFVCVRICVISWLIRDVEKFYDTTSDIQFRDEEQYSTDEEDKWQKKEIPFIRKPKEIEIVLKKIKNKNHWCTSDDKNERGKD
jgi:hypothetical protein